MVSEKITINRTRQDYEHLISLGYTPVYYIENTANAYINTGHNPTPVTCCVADYMAVRNQSLNGLFGALRTSGSDVFGVWYRNSSGKTSAIFGTQSHSFANGSINERHTVALDGTNVYYDGSLVHAFESAQFVCRFPVHLFRINYYNSGVSGRGLLGRVYGFKQYDGDTLVCDYIPCTDGDGVAGMFDMVSGQFLDSDGNDAFTAGAVLPLPSEDDTSVELNIYGANNALFHNLKLRKFAVESVVMSLGDKISGDVHYKDNTLAFTMKEYVEYKGVKYSLVNPPTVVREGMVSSNSDLKGMTKYSLVFYHPMYMLGNFPFTDIAVSPSETHLSQNKTFSWIGTLFDYIAKLNANLKTTEWFVQWNIEHYEQDGETETALWKKASTLSDVLSFDKKFVSDALKTGYDTWEIPFVVYKTDQIVDGVRKKFVVEFGIPSQEIYDENGDIFVFRFGQEVGLKNNSRSPRNNKIVTRICGYGAERNIPYGYPQIVWDGNQEWDYTIDNDPDAVNSYPIYDGIVGGQKVRLIKHPFTRTTLQPSVYSDTLNKKVNPLATGYNPNIEIKDYYDATAGTYSNPINLAAPSVEIHQFEKIYPRLDENTKIVGVSAYEDKTKSYVKYDDFISMVNALIASAKNQHEKDALNALKTSMLDTTVKYNSATTNGGGYTYAWHYKLDSNFYYVEYTSDRASFNETVLRASLDEPEFVWDDSMDDEGNLVQSYFRLTLPVLSFDLYASAALTEKMEINMRSGACLGCTFHVQVDWEDYKANFFHPNGKFDPVIHTTEGDGHIRNGEKYPDSSQEQITVIVAKDLDTFGTVMPNSYQMVAANDTFVVLGISLPLSYISSAELELDDAMRQYMLENNVFYYDYPLKFDEYFFAKNPYVRRQIKNNNVLRFMFGETTLALFIKQITVKYGDGVLPVYDITMTDDIEIVLNSIGQVTDDVSRMRVQLSELQRYYSQEFVEGINTKLSRVADDVALGRITFQQGINTLAASFFGEEIRSDNYEVGLGGRGWRIDQLGNAELESLRVRSFLEVIELLVNRVQAQEGDTMFTDNDQIDKVEQVTSGGSTSYILSLKEKYDGYVTSQMYGNILRGMINTLAAKQAGVSDESNNHTSYQGEDYGGNKYYTSWMRVIGTHTTDNTLGINQIRVVLYSDGDTPAGYNFKPCELMVITRWGCSLNPNESGISDGEKLSRTQRQRMFMISVSDGRVVKYTGVNAPKLTNGNYGVTIGELPEFVKRYTKVSEVLAQVGEHTDWLYAQGVVVGKFIKVDIEGNPEITYVDCGEWVDGEDVQDPSPRNGIYLCNEYNSISQQYETNDVWRNGSMWRCLQHQPVVSGGTTTYYEPTDENYAYWRKMTGTASSTVVATLDNDMDSISCDNSGKPQTAQSVFTVAALYQGSTAETLNNMRIYDENTGGYEYTSGTAHDGITVTWNESTGRIDVAFATNVVQPTKRKFCIELVGSVTRYKYFTVLCERGLPLYKLVVSTTVVVKHKDNSYTPSSDVTCGVTKLVNGVTTEPAASEYTLNTYIDGSSTPAASSTVAPSAFTNNIRYDLVVGGRTVDTQTVSMLTDGTDGESPYILDFDNEMDSVACGTGTHPVVQQSVSTTLTLWKGATKRAFSVIGVTRNGSASLGTGVSINLSLPAQSDSDNEVTLTVTYATTAEINKKDDFEITVQDASESTVVKSLHFTVNGIEGNTIYNVQPSTSQIKLPKNYASTTASITCGYTKNELGDITTVADVSSIIDGYCRLLFRRHSKQSGAFEIKSYAYENANNKTLLTSLDIINYDGVMFYLYKDTDITKTEFALVDSTKVIDKEYVPVVTDGEDGDDITYQISTNVESVLVPQGQSRAAQFDLVFSFNKFVNGVPSIQDAYWGFYLRVGSSYYRVSSGQVDTTVSSSVTMSDITPQGGAILVIFWFDSAYSGNDPLSQTYYQKKEIPVIPSGATGQRGLTGRFYYYAEDWNAADNTQTYPANDYQVPYFRVVSGNTKSYYVYIGENWANDLTMYQINETYGAPSNSNANWKIMYDDFEYIITKAIFGEFAKFGSAIINGDWMISTNGTINGTAYNNGALYNGVPAYTYFDAQHPNDNTGTNFIPNYAIDLLTGATYQNDAYIRGEIYAKTLKRSVASVYVEVSDWTRPNWDFDELVPACGGQLPSILVLKNFADTIYGSSSDTTISNMNVYLPPASEWQGHQMTIYIQRKYRKASGSGYNYYPCIRLFAIDENDSDVGFQNVMFNRNDGSMGYAYDGGAWVDPDNVGYSDSVKYMTVISTSGTVNTSGGERTVWRWMVLESSCSFHDIT